MGADPQRPHDRPGDNSPVAGVVFSTGLWAFLAVPLAIVVAFVLHLLIGIVITDLLKWGEH